LIFSGKKSPGFQAEQLDALFRVIQQLLEGYALHSVEFDSIEHMAFRSSIREIASRFSQHPDYKDLLILAGEANKTIQAYNELAEKFIREVSAEKQLAVKLLAQSLLRVCHSSEKSAETLRRIETELASAIQVQDMRELRAQMTACLASICLEAEIQDAQHRDLKERISESPGVLDLFDQVTGLRTINAANSRIQELSAPGNQAYVMAFFLKNVELVNRRFGFVAGDDVLRGYAAYLGKHLQGADQLFRWRGPCFVLLTERFASPATVRSEADRMGLRGPEHQVESEGKSMLLRLIAATATFPIPKGRSCSELSAKVDQFAVAQSKMAPAAR
jgi:GGDEF domain-containing protein